MDKDIGFTFDIEEIEREVVMLESHYDRLINDNEQMAGEIDYLLSIIDYLKTTLEENEVEYCTCRDCIMEFIGGDKVN